MNFMKQKILSLAILITMGVVMCLFKYIPIFYLKQDGGSEDINFTLYKNPWYYQTNIIVSTKPFIMTEITKTSKWKWNIDIKGIVSVFPKVYIQIINADTGSVITEKNINTFPAANLATTQQDDLVTKINNNYPYRELFPHVSSTMIADYTDEPKIILIIRKTDIDVSSLTNELDLYLKKNLTSLDLLKQNGVIINYSKEVNQQAVKVVE